MIWSIIDKASVYFEECPQDFGIQHCSGTSFIFGGSNRLLWNASAGFWADRSFCSAAFLEHHDKMQRARFNVRGED